MSDVVTETEGEAVPPVLTEAAMPPVETAGAPEPMAVGARLRAGREARKLSVAEVAQSMKLSTRQVEALESGDWKVLPGTTFVRGFTRNYARLVQIDPDVLMAELDVKMDKERLDLALPNTDTAAMPVAGHEGSRRDYAFAVIGLVFALLAAALYFLFPEEIVVWRDRVKSSIAEISQPAPVVKTAALPVEPEPVLPPGASVQEVLNPQSVAAGETPDGPGKVDDAGKPLVDTAHMATAEKTVEKAAEPERQAGTPGLIRIKVSKESWVEVRDRSGNVLLSQRVPTGAERGLDGQAPFSVTLGYAPGVSIQYKGKDVDVAAFTKGDVARLTLE